MTIVATVRAGVITAHAASGLLLVRTVLVARPVRVVHIRIAPPRPRVVALEVSPPILGFDTVFYSFTSAQPHLPVSKHKRGGGLAISAQNLLQLPPTLHEAAGVPWSLYRCADLLQMPLNLLRSGGAVVVRPSAGGRVHHISQTAASAVDHPLLTPHF